ncbi:MAG: DUF3160 domain-containing protein [Spirochaetales bacterium]|nr:DUF3160 domain-containing protein [Spirochaetales bacterium]
MQKLSLFIVVVLFVFSSCLDTKHETAGGEGTEEASGAVDETPLILDDSDLKAVSASTDGTAHRQITYSDSSWEMPPYKAKTPVYDVPVIYLNDPVEFHSLDYEQWRDGKIAVIGSDRVFLYEDVFSSGATAAEHIEGRRITQIKKGTIIPILHEYTNTNDEYDGLFKFMDEYNYWYRTEYNGRTGIVFGAFLIGAGRYGNRGNTDDAVRLSYYYNKPEKETRFYDHVGNRRVIPVMRRCLSADAIAFQKVERDEYRLSSSRPDDLVSLYQQLQDDRTTTMFITTDLLLHCMHLLFDRMLEYTEENFFLPLLESLVYDFLSELVTYESRLDPGEDELRAAIGMLRKYFTVADGIFIAGKDLSIKENEYLEEYYYDEEEPVFEADVQNLFSGYPDDVRRELELIFKASESTSSPVFGYKEDYSQFKPRGHYTRSENLKTYFRVMMWFGRLHFTITDKSPEKLKLSKEMVPAVLLLTKIVRSNVDIFRKWRALFEPITYLIGSSDDWSFNDISLIIGSVDLENLGVWLEDDGNITGFIGKAVKELRSPGIKGMSTGTDEGPDTGFRLFGQRFTVDSFIHNNLAIYPYRLMVKGLDIMGVFGSKKAAELLRSDMDEVEGYRHNFYYLADMIGGYDEYDWRRTFYNGYLRLIKEITTFEKGAGFFFTKSDKWDFKALLTSHAGWAELRHDTILYVKQSYAEMGGMGYEPTFDIDPVPRPISYVEPNLGFFYRLGLLLKDSISMLTQDGMMNDDFRYKFNDFKGIVDMLTTIVELEARDRPITEEQNDYIVSVPSKLARIILPPDVDLDAYAMGDDDFKMPIIADVHTADGSCLEVGTGIPYRFYVALNDGQGGKRIAIGYTYRYYEFTQPITNRLDDDQWRAMVYGGDGALSSKIPGWAAGIACE